MARNDTGARFTVSLVVGLLLIPLSAVAAYAIVSGTGSDDGEVAASTSTTAAGVSTTMAQEATVTVEPVSASAADLAQACGPDGLWLVQQEAAGSLTEVQQASLDALRRICDEAGAPLPGPPAPPPVVRTVTRVDASATTSTSMPHDDDEYGDDDHDDYEDDDYEDDDHDDDHDDDDHEDDDHDEDDDHEDDD